LNMKNTSLVQPQTNYRKPAWLHHRARSFTADIEQRLRSCIPSPRNWLSEVVPQELSDLSEFLKRRIGPARVHPDWYASALLECERIRTAWTSYPTSLEGQRAALELVRSEASNRNDSLAVVHMQCAATNIEGFVDSASRKMRAIYLASILDGPVCSALRGVYVGPQPTGSSHLIAAPVYVLDRIYDVYQYYQRPASTLDWSVWRPVCDPVHAEGVDLELLRMVWQRSRQTMSLEKIVRAAAALHRAEVSRNQL
jgi:hypothetical protein